MATHSSIVAWRIPRTEEPEGYSPRSCKESDTTERLNNNIGLKVFPENHSKSKYQETLSFKNVYSLRFFNKCLLIFFSSKICFPQNQAIRKTILFEIMVFWLLCYPFIYISWGCSTHFFPLMLNKSNLLLQLAKMKQGILGSNITKIVFI